MTYPITKCPKCGNDEFYVKMRISGVCRYNVALDGSLNACNGEMYENTNTTLIGKYAYCNNCEKRLFEITKEMPL